MLMNKNHLQKLSEEQLDKLIQNVLHSTILTDEEVEEIANSPRLLRQVQSRIADEKACGERRWFLGWRWQMATAGAFAILIAAGAAFWSFDSARMEIAAVRNEEIIVPAEEIKPIETISDAPQLIASPIVAPEKSIVKTNKVLSKTKPKIKPVRVQFAPRSLAKAKTSPSPKTEISTEFIALSYLPATDSGQIVRVKVPRSMLVSLGVTTNVEKNSELVNAEVILGDDGAARAIRFLGQ